MPASLFPTITAPQISPNRSAFPIPGTLLGIPVGYLLLGLPVLVLLSACRAAPAPEAITAQEVLAHSASAMAEVNTFHFELTHPTGTTSLPGGLALVRATGSVHSPDRLRVNAEANFGRIFVKVQAVIIGTQTYMTNFLTGAWSEIAPEDSPFGFLDPPKFVADVLQQVQDPVLEDGHQTSDFIVRGSISAAPFAALVGTVDAGKNARVRLAIDRTTFHLKEALIEGAVQPEDGPATARLIRLSAIGEPVVIEKPA